MNQELRVGRSSLVIRREPWDCEQLGLEAGKLERLQVIEDSEGKDLVRQALRLSDGKLAHLAARVDSLDRLALRALQANDFRIVDAVVHYGLELESLPERAPVAGFTIRLAVGSDIDSIAELAATAFSDPGASFNRYLNDGGFTHQQVRRVYETWGRTSVAGAAADFTWLALNGAELAGFLTLKVPDMNRLARVPLNAVASRYRGRGLYTSLVATAAHAARELGATDLAVTTQLQQLAVQRTWQRLGAVPLGSSFSLHRWVRPSEFT